MGNRFDLIELGPLSGWNQYSGGIVPTQGRKMVDKDIPLEYFGVSINSREPGGEAGYWHAHSTLEELYLFLEGEGEMALDDQVIPVRAGSAVRVGQDVMRSWRALPSSPTALKWICIRAGGAKLSEIGRDARPIPELPRPWDHS